MPRTTWSYRFEQALMNLPNARAVAVAEAVERFADDPSAPALAFRPMQHRLNHFVVTTRYGDRLILKLEDDVYVAVDVGPYATIYRDWGI